MRFLSIIFFFSMLGCGRPNSNSTANANPDVVQEAVNSPKDLIPQTVKDYLTKNFAEWIIPDTADYIKAWWSFYDKTQIPYFVTTDFNDDQAADYAFILKHENSLKLVILTSAGNSFTPWIAEDFKETLMGPKSLQFGLAVEPPGRIDCLVDNKEQSLVLQSNGIALMALEQKCTIYYWSSGNYKMFKVKSQSSNFTVK